MEFGALGEFIVAHLMPGVRHGKRLLIDLVVTTSPKNGKSQAIRSSQGCFNSPVKCRLLRSLLLQTMAINIHSFLVAPQ